MGEPLPASVIFSSDVSSVVFRIPVEEFLFNLKKIDSEIR
jgi:hypothetical protein